ncbi:unnamed protein product [Protopolystoma xenopodis]|uniref:RING-type domain-containing protein n=1 Tax=Protopolystoma xenopodis TaxID=117903 RepID=A0A3S5FDZ6_9PLAT|nr:unnamed protein product [Protopolystoma xenopodis]
MRRCNYRKCRQKISNQAFITYCGHIFCVDHNPWGFKPVSSGNFCPSCGEPLTEDSHVLQSDFLLIEKRKTMLLNGVNPETVLEIAREALLFYWRQTIEYAQYMEYCVKKTLDQFEKRELGYKSHLSRLEQEKQQVLLHAEQRESYSEEIKDKLVLANQRISALEAQIQTLNGQHLDFSKNIKQSMNPLNQKQFLAKENYLNWMADADMANINTSVFKGAEFSLILDRPKHPTKSLQMALDFSYLEV